MDDDRVCFTWIKAINSDICIFFSRESSYAMLFFLKFFVKEIVIQPPAGEPREQHLGEVQHLNCYWYKQSSYFFCESSNIFYFFLFCKKVNSYHQVLQENLEEPRKSFKGRSKFKRSNVSTATLFFGIWWKTCWHLSIIQKWEQSAAKKL